MSNLANKSIHERTTEIEDALAAALNLDGIEIGYDKGSRELIVADPADYAPDCWFTHDLWSIARDIERRLFPNG